MRYSNAPHGWFSPASTDRKAAGSVIGSRERHSTARTPNAGWAPMLVTVPRSTAVVFLPDPVVRRLVSSTFSSGAAARAGDAGTTSVAATVIIQASTRTSLAGTARITVPS